MAGAEESGGAGSVQGSASASKSTDVAEEADGA